MADWFRIYKGLFGWQGLVPKPTRKLPSLYAGRRLALIPPKQARLFLDEYFIPKNVRPTTLKKKKERGEKKKKKALVCPGGKWRKSRPPLEVWTANRQHNSGAIVFRTPPLSGLLRSSPPQSLTINTVSSPGQPSRQPSQLLFTGLHSYSWALSASLSFSVT